MLTNRVCAAGRSGYVAYGAPRSFDSLLKREVGRRWGVAPLFVSSKASSRAVLAFLRPHASIPPEDPAAACRRYRRGPARMSVTDPDRMQIRLCGLRCAKTRVQAASMGCASRAVCPHACELACCPAAGLTLPCAAHCLATASVLRASGVRDSRACMLLLVRHCQSGPAGAEHAI